MTYNGLGVHLGNLWQISNARTRSISAENPTGEKAGGGLAPAAAGHASRQLGQGWKCRPCVQIKAGETFDVADIQGPGAIQHIWMTGLVPRFSILRIYWDDQEHPSIEVPAADFFCCGWGQYAQVTSLPVCVNPGSGMNCWWEMPFRKRCRITLENIGPKDHTLFYQVDYTLTEVPDDAAYFHAQFRRSNPLPYKQTHTILDGVRGVGQYVGTYMAWGVNNTGWWGEGEIKFYLDGDPDGAKPGEPPQGAPTICGTGTEDYFLGSYNFDPGTANECTFGTSFGEAKRYQEFTGPYAGMPQVIRPDGVYASQMRFGLYRWHIPDPIRFRSDLKVTIQALGWRKSEWVYLPLQDDISSVAYWYQTLPGAPLPPLPPRDSLEII